MIKNRRFDMMAFSEENRIRSEHPEGFNGKLSDWSAAEWTNAMAGECGEACNITKKMLRHETSVSGNTGADRDYQNLRERAAEEVADVIIYADLVIQALGFNTAEVLAKVWDAKSEKLGWDRRIKPVVP